MDTIKLKLLTGRSGDDGSYSPGEIIDLPIKEAIALVNSDQALPTNKKAYDHAVLKLESVKNAEAERLAQSTAILEKETLVSELRELYAQVALKAAQIEGVVLSDEEVEAFVEKSMIGEDPSDEAKKTEDFPAGKSDDNKDEE
jgi:hypothetical protein